MIYGYLSCVPERCAYFYISGLRFFTAALKDQMIEHELGLDWTKEISIGASGIGPLSEEVERAKNGARFIRNDLLG